MTAHEQRPDRGKVGAPKSEQASRDTRSVPRGSDGPSVPNLSTIAYVVSLTCVNQGCTCPEPEFSIRRLEPFPYVQVHHDDGCPALARRAA